MKKYLCTFSLPNEPDDAFWELIPRHRNYINGLMRNEVIVTYSVNQQRTKGWVVINAANKQEVVHVVEQFPIRSFIDIHVEELFIFDSMIGTPKLVLN